MKQELLDLLLKLRRVGFDYGIGNISYDEFTAKSEQLLEEVAAYDSRN